MGKKSKRNRSSKQQVKSGDDEDNTRLAPGLRKDNEEEEEETLDNLRFEDPYVDEFEVEEDVVMDDEDDDEIEEENGDDGGGLDVVQSWHPLMIDGKTGQQQQISPKDLEMDPTAYKMYHSLLPEWPSLTFDFLRDELGMGRTRFPHSLQVVVGSQADQSYNNQITIMKLSDLGRLSNGGTKDDLEDILGEEYDSKKKNKDGDGDDDDSSSSSDEEEDDIDLDPILESFSIPHYGGVNRLRVMPQQSNIVATWSDVGKVHLFNIEHIRSRFSASVGIGNLKPPATTSTSNLDKPYYTHDGHGVEGYALDWSPVQQGTMCTGDCNGNIHLWTPRPEGGGYEVTPSYAVDDYNTGSDVEKSVEDLQWSPTEGTVFASAECGGMIRIFDTRAPHRAMVSQLVHEKSKADVNVLSWNKLVTNLLATGGDDGTLSVWDLRHFSSSSSSSPASTSATTTTPLLARFSPHKTPLTSVEWHPTDESMLAVSDAVGAYVYDLSVEEDDSTAKDVQTYLGGIIPPQMLFAHAGSQDFKELHWHPQISSCLMTTALTGFSIFIPSNL